MDKERVSWLTKATEARVSADIISTYYTYVVASQLTQQFTSQIHVST